MHSYEYCVDGLETYAPVGLRKFDFYKSGSSDNKLANGASDVLGLVVDLTRQQDYVADVFRKKMWKSADVEPNKDFEGHFAKLEAVEANEDLWPRGAEAPNATAVNWARKVLKQLQVESFQPTRVVASAEGGIAICFVSGDKYCDIETLNSGVLLGVTTNRRDRPTAWEIEPSTDGISQSIVRVRAFIERAPSGSDDSRRTKRRRWGFFK